MDGQRPQSARTYENALGLLKTLQSNRAIKTVLADSKDDDPNRLAIPEMLEWAQKAGYKATELGKHGQKYIHVAGTKGKGSVCVMVENILLQYSRAKDTEKQVGKIGMYTSPHLVTVRERIRIDGAPISEQLFARYFFELWDRFETAASKDMESDVLSATGEIAPGYFRYLTLLALHAFRQEGVKTAIMECGIGGEYDSTNILPADAVAVSAITSLGIDHTAMLGETIDEIAWHKAGIMKEGVPAFTVDQRPEAQAVLDKRAAEKRVELNVVEMLPQLKSGFLAPGLLGDFQNANASLATAVAASYLHHVGVTENVPLTEELSNSTTGLPEQFMDGIETVHWPGRCEIRKDGNLEWYIDGAHTMESIEAAGEWFLHQLAVTYSEPNPPTATMLIFNQDERDGLTLLRKLLNVLSVTPVRARSRPTRRNKQEHVDEIKSETRLRLNPIFRYAAFPTNEPFATANEGKTTDLKKQEEMALRYQSIDGNALHVAYGSVEEAVRLAMRVSKGDERVLVLVTGSLYLVGGLLQVLEMDKEFLQVEDPVDEEEEEEEE